MSAPVRIAITLGDVCGIGPEIVLKALSDPRIAAQCTVIGDRGVLERQALALQLPMPPTLEAITTLSADPGGLPVPGRADARAGDAAYRYVVHAARMASSGRVDAIVTAPLAKSAMHAAGHRYPGHTELLAELAGGVDVRMMLANEELRTVLVSVHESLRDAIDHVRKDQVRRTIEITDAGLRRAGIERPRIAVAGLNPHAGEAGAFGTEEIDEIAPAIADARAAGIDASGPFPPDTVFMQARGFSRFDVVVAMYHDQGLIPVKYMGIDKGVNVTLGLPWIRTSPDHGTAFDIAGRGCADPASLLAAIRAAQALARDGMRTR
ncbi:MAG: 4-hydroxythreonine-4-phosphate dehydrogenase PdxA [Burkholderiaceae bacterium]|nr:4-hydroxythreonine-4-phosphate dehydrogenase PdxA [Burkholderiaceae bacterium]